MFGNRTLGEITESIDYGVTASAAPEPVGPKFLRITDIQDGMVDWDRVPWCECDSRSAQASRLQTGDIVFARTGGTTGKSFLIAECPDDAVFASYLIRVRFTRGIEPKYVNHYFQSPSYWAQISRGARGAAQPGVNATTLKALQIPLPPLDDQKRIAHLLGKVEGLIAQRKQHLQQLDVLLKSVFLEMFGPRNTDYRTWPEVEIRSLAADHKGAMRTGPFGSNLLHSEFTENGDVAVLGIDNAVQNRFSLGEPRFITSEKYKELESYRIFPDDVIVTIMGTIGRSAVIPKDIPLAINTKHLAAITLNRQKANPVFLSYSIHSSPYILSQFKSKNRGAIMSGLNLGLIKETKLRHPPIDLQNRFANIHQRVDEIKDRYQQSLADLEVLYGALSQKAFAGELDLSRVPLPVEERPARARVGLEQPPSEESWFDQLFRGGTYWPEAFVEAATQALHGS